MIKILIENSIKEFNRQIESTNSPVPAGGSVVASTALGALSLLKLVAKVSKKELKNNSKKSLATYLKKLAQIQIKLSPAIDQDVKNFKINQEHNFSQPEKLKKLVEAPLVVAQSSYKVLELTAEVQAQFKTNVKADYQVAIFNLEASLKGAIAIIEANYQFLTKKEIKQLKKQVAELTN